MTLVDPFATAAELTPFLSTDKEEKRFGNVYNGKYHMPLLPGEAGTKSGGDWVPYGMTRMTNLAGAFVDTEALSIWEQEQGFIGLALDVSLYEEVCLLVRQAMRDGVDFQRLRDFPEVRRALTGTWKERGPSIVGRAKQRAGANDARQKGINRHKAWEIRANGGPLFGSPDMQAQIIDLETLLADAHLERLPGFSERVIRNDVLRCAGRFDDILVDTRTGELFIADLKTKAREFFTWLEIDIQLAGYAHAEWMLQDVTYVAGPLTMVNQERGVVLHMPSDGARPRLRVADLVRGWRNAQTARYIMDERSYGKSVERLRFPDWS